MYHNPSHDPVCKLTEKELQEGFDAVYEDLYCELSKFGHLLELHVSYIQSANLYLSYRVFFCRSVTTLEITSSATCMRVMNGKPKRKPQSTVVTSAGMQVRSRSFSSVLYMRPDATLRQTTLRRAFPRDRLPRGLLPPERKRRVQPRRLLQLHASAPRIKGPRLFPARRPAPGAPPQPIQGRDWRRRLGAHQAGGRQGPERKSPETRRQRRRGPMDEKVGMLSWLPSTCHPQNCTAYHPLSFPLMLNICMYVIRLNRNFYTSHCLLLNFS